MVEQHRYKIANFLVWFEQKKMEDAWAYVSMWWFRNLQLVDDLE